MDKNNANFLQFQGISRALTCLFMVISLKLFPIMEKQLHLSGSFYLYSSILTFSLPIIMFFMPETKNLSIYEINDLFIKNKDIRL